MNAKIRSAQKMKVPYMLVVGAKEADAGTLNVRRSGSKETKDFGVDEFISMVQNKIADRSIGYEWC